jgi:hypothetical protein
MMAPKYFVPYPPATRGRIIVFGLAFWYPLAGVTFQFLHYLIGLRRLGWDVYYVEDSSRQVYDVSTQLFTYDWDSTGNVERVGRVLDEHGFEGKWAARCRIDNFIWGMTPSELAELYRTADAFLHVCGGQEMLDEHLRIPRRVYVETDPVITQIRVAEKDAGQIALLDAHDTHFSYGENFSAPDCGVPIERYNWLPTRQPVAMELWPWDEAPGEAYTTIATWDNKGNDIHWNGDVYRWSKRPEYMKIVDLPSRCKVRCEIAAGVPEEDGLMLDQHGWYRNDPIAISSQIESYSQYIRTSRAELSVAKDQNIRLRSGWFSDRSCCFLAAGRPVITQDTAFCNVLPTGRGLFAFQTQDDILAAMEDIESNYAQQRLAAFEIAQEYFSAEKVLQSICERAGL